MNEQNNMNKVEPSIKKPLLLLIVAPLLLFAITMAVAMYFGIATRNSQAVSENINKLLPYILIVNHTILFLILLKFLRSDGLNLKSIGWWLPQGKKSLWLEPLIGIFVGIVLGLFEHFALSPMLEVVRQLTWDYAGAPTYVGNIIPWLISSTLFAGVVEESIYRGYAITLLKSRIGLVGAVSLSSLMFGFLHWGEGLWMMVAAMILGAFLAGIFIWRKNLLVSAVAHAVINVIALLLS